MILKYRDHLIGTGKIIGHNHKDISAGVSRTRLYVEGNVLTKQQDNKEIEIAPHLQTVLNNVGACIYMKDVDGRYTYVNKRVQKLFNCPYDEIIGETSDKFFDEINLRELKTYDRRVLEFGESIEMMEENTFAKTGETRFYWSVKAPLWSEDGRIVGMSGISTDVTERHKAELQEKFRSEILEMVANDEPLDDIMAATVSGVESCNPQMLCSILLLDKSGRHLLASAAPSLPDFYNQAVDGLEIGDGVGCCGTAAFTGKRVVVADIMTHEYWVAFRDLAKRAGLASCWSQPILSRSGMVLGTFAIYHRQPQMPSETDINLIEQTAHLISIAIERRAMEDEIRQLAFYDPLTNLPNRRLLHDRLNQCLISSKRTGAYGALLFLDLDNFKPLNDLYGHRLGDELLIQAANRLCGCVREVDTVARFGGDEFIVLIKALSLDEAESKAQAQVIAEKIRATLWNPYQLTVREAQNVTKTIEFQCTASIGVVVFDNRNGDQNDILKWCDAAMYKAKEAGRNSIRFYES